jgi:hydroxyacylglutathione hydrolase
VTADRRASRPPDAGVPDPPAVRVLPLRVKGVAFVNYCYVALHERTRDAVVVDPAWELGTIERALAARGAWLRGILLTHAHEDHVNLADALATRHGCPVHMSEDEIECYGFRCSNLRPFRSEAPIRAGALEIEPIATPGHTKGAVCYRIGDDLFAGDTLFAEGCGLCVGRGADPDALFDSLQKLKARLGPATRIFPGHSYGVPPGQPFSSLLAGNIYLMFERRSHFVSFRMRPNQKGTMQFK